MASAKLVSAGSTQTFDSSIVDYFDLPPTDLTAQKTNVVEYSPVAAGSPANFVIEDETNFIDLTRSYFTVQFKFTTPVGANIPTASHIFPPSIGVHGFFKQVDMWLNKTLLTSQSEMYPWKVAMAQALNYTPEEIEDVLSATGAYRTGDFPSPITANNLNDGQPHQNWTDLTQTAKDAVYRGRIKKTSLITAADASITSILTFTPLLEMFQTNKLLPPGMRMEFQFTLNDPKFFLTTNMAAVPILDMGQFKIRFHAQTINLRSSVAEKILTKMASGGTIKYPLITTEVRRFIIPADSVEYTVDQIFESRIPFRFHAAMVAQQNFLGTKAYDPFLFRRYGMTESRLLIDDQLVGGKPVRYAAGASNTDLIGYDRFRRESGLQKTRGRCLVDADTFKQGAFLQCWDLTPTGSTPNYAHMLPKGRGNMRLEMSFDLAGGKPIIYLIVFGEFQSTLEIASDKTVYFDARG